MSATSFYRHCCGVAAVSTLALGLACKREERRFTATYPSAPAYAAVTLDTLQPGVPSPELTVNSPAEGNAYDIAQGKLLFAQWNCTGCHSHGGGGMGPPLMDNEWIYGSSPENIVATIVEGRPNGMPSFRNRITANQLWQLAAYVRSLAGLEAKGPSPGRNDEMQYKVDEQRTPFRTPRASSSRNVPAKSERP
ncbi:MAG TPA: c-type cytochrome [Gemmatimonadaceae bacterium]|jgi:cytochrome c oxidase cbb3-type subunit 3|nr:c-type cytochrome [Gemmatimonadaceae bacterium]